MHNMQKEANKVNGKDQLHAQFKGNRLGRPIDAGEVQRYLELLGGGAREFYFASFYDPKEKSESRRPYPQHRFGAFEGHRDWIVGRQRERCGMFVAIQQMRGKVRGNSEVVRYRAVLADLDKGWPEGGFPIEPSCVIETSPGRWQVLWIIDEAGEPLSAEDYAEIMKCMVDRYGHDKNAVDSARVLRVPGTWNFKYGEPHLVRITEATGCVYGSEELLKHFTMLREKPKASKPTPRPPRSGDKHQRRIRAKFEKGFADDCAMLASLPPGSRHGALFERASRWGTYVHHGIASEAEVVEGLLNAARANGLAAEENSERTIRDGIARAANDAYPTLEDRPRQHRPASGAAPNTKSELAWPELSRGLPRSRSIKNVEAFLAHLGVAFSHNEFTRENYAIIGGKQRPVTDEMLRGYRMQAERMGFSPPREFFDDVCLDQCRGNSFNPLLDYLDGLQWEGTPRLDRVLCDYFGAADTPLNRAMGRKHLIAAVMRARRPGAKHDAILCLEGPQGVGKSTGIRALAGDEYFTDALTIGAEAKEVIEQARGAWLAEIAELSGIRKNEVEAVKVMISRQADRARLSYDRHTSELPRQFVLFGTVNDSHYLKDSTGNRRFWVVKTGKIDVAGIRRDRDQIWAEAAHYARMGESNELPEELWTAAAEQQAARVEKHRWAEILEDHLDQLCDRGGQKITGTVLSDHVWGILNLDAKQAVGRVGAELNGIMSQMGWKKSRLRHQGALKHCFTNQVDGDATRWLVLGQQGGTHPERY